MHRALISLLLGALLLLAGCAARQPNVAHPAPSRDPRALPKYDEFWASIKLPYHAPEFRRRQIERAALALHQGMSSAQVIGIAGRPDYAMPWASRVNGKIATVGEIWIYAHTFERELEPGYHGNLLSVAIRKKSGKSSVESVDFSVQHPIPKRSE